LSKESNNRLAVGERISGTDSPLERLSKAFYEKELTGVDIGGTNVKVVATSGREVIEEWRKSFSSLEIVAHLAKRYSPMVVSWAGTVRYNTVLLPSTITDDMEFDVFQQGFQELQQKYRFRAIEDQRAGGIYVRDTYHPQKAMLITIASGAGGIYFDDNGNIPDIFFNPGRLVISDEEVYHTYTGERGVAQQLINARRLNQDPEKFLADFRLLDRELKKHFDINSYFFGGGGCMGNEDILSQLGKVIEEPLFFCALGALYYGRL